MEFKQLAISVLFALGIAACGGAEFSAGPTPVEDAATNQDAIQPEEAGKDANHDIDTGDAGQDTKPEGSIPDADAGEDGDVQSTEVGPEASPEAEPDVTEETAVPESGTDAADEPDAVGPDATEPDADPCPNGGILNVAPGDCGTIPSSGIWICYVLPHAPICGTVGLAGGNPPNGLAPDPYYHDPMVASGGPCVAGSDQDGFVLCKVPAPSGTKVYGTAGLHQPNGPTLDGRFACDAQNCRGRAIVYKDGTEIGGMQNSAGYGVVNLVDFQGRKNLLVNVP